MCSTTVLLLIPKAVQYLLEILFTDEAAWLPPISNLLRHIFGRTGRVLTQYLGSNLENTFTGAYETNISYFLFSHRGFNFCLKPSPEDVDKVIASLKKSDY